MSFVLTWIATAIATTAAIWLVPGITAVGGSFVGPVMCALALAFVNATIKPIMQVLSLPFTVLTLGFFYLVVNALMLQLASWLSSNLFGAGIYIRGFGSALFGAIVISIVSSIMGGLLGADD